MQNSHSDRSDCPIACGLDLIGDRWTLIIVRDMIYGNIHEFKDFKKSKEKISTNILSDRLKLLYSNELIDYVFHPEDKKRKLYYLTKNGKALIYILIEISKWSKEHFQEEVSMPAEFYKLMKRNPEKLIASVFDVLKKWEDENIPN